MGTRSLTRIYDEHDGAEIICMYRQYDGYPSGHGAELAAFVAARTLTNGIGAPNTSANGMGCLAAQVVAFFKTEGGEKAPMPGNFYLYAPGTSDVGEEYVYEVRHASFKCFKTYAADPHTPIYDGTASDFAAFVKAGA